MFPMFLFTIALCLQLSSASLLSVLRHSDVTGERARDERADWHLAGPNPILAPVPDMDWQTGGCQFVSLLHSPLTPRRAEEMLVLCGPKADKHATAAPVRTHLGVALSRSLFQPWQMASSPALAAMPAPHWEGGVFHAFQALPLPVETVAGKAVKHVGLYVAGAERAVGVAFGGRFREGKTWKRAMDGPLLSRSEVCSHAHAGCSCQGAELVGIIPHAGSLRLYLRAKTRQPSSELLVYNVDMHTLKPSFHRAVTLPADMRAEELRVTPSHPHSQGVTLVASSAVTGRAAVEGGLPSPVLVAKSKDGLTFGPSQHQLAESVAAASTPSMHNTLAAQLSPLSEEGVSEGLSMFHTVQWNSFVMDRHPVSIGAELFLPSTFSAHVPVCSLHPQAALDMTEGGADPLAQGEESPPPFPTLSRLPAGTTSPWGYNRVLHRYCAPVKAVMRSAARVAYELRPTLTFMLEGGCSPDLEGARLNISVDVHGLQRARPEFPVQGPSDLLLALPLSGQCHAGKFQASTVGSKRTEADWLVPLVTFNGAEGRRGGELLAVHLHVHYEGRGEGDVKKVDKA